MSYLNGKKSLLIDFFFVYKGKIYLFISFKSSKFEPNIFSNKQKFCSNIKRFLNKSEFLVYHANIKSKTDLFFKLDTTDLRFLFLIMSMNLKNKLAGYQGFLEKFFVV